MLLTYYTHTYIWKTIMYKYEEKAFTLGKQIRTIEGFLKVKIYPNYSDI